MPNKTIYVADADLPIFEQAQDLAGENLSATIVQALHRFVEAEAARAQGFGEITLKVGNHGTYANKAFLGRELAKRCIRDLDAHRIVTQNVYQTVKGRLVLYTRTFPDWYAWQSYVEDEERGQRRGHGRHDINVEVDVDMTTDEDSIRRKRRHEQNWQQWQHRDWSAWRADLVGNEYRMEVHETLDDLKSHIPEELYNAAMQALKGEDVEFLDI
jgi:EXLDI family protein